jgi:hypothetical protein
VVGELDRFLTKERNAFQVFPSPENVWRFTEDFDVLVTILSDSISDKQFSDKQFSDKQFSDKCLSLTFERSCIP